MITEDAIRRLAESLGADLMGFADVSCLPSQVTNGLTRAISIGVALDPTVIREIESGPTLRYFAEYNRANALLDQVSSQVVAAIRDGGHKARAFQPTSEQVDKATLTATLQHKTVATRAGLGWIGKSGLLVTKEYGAAVRLASVLTDAPLAVGEPTNAANCGDCHRCVDRCPAQAVAGGVWQPGVARDHLYNAAACFVKAREFAKQNGVQATICGVCINACPWTQRYLAREPSKR
jgi:epoxyqueuosine reductase QueG